MLRAFKIIIVIYYCEYNFWCWFLIYNVIQMFTNKFSLEYLLFLFIRFLEVFLFFSFLHLDNKIYSFT